MSGDIRWTDIAAIGATLLQAQAEARGNVFSGGFLEVSDDGNYGLLRGPSICPATDMASALWHMSWVESRGHSGSPLLLMRRSPGPAWPQSVTASTAVQTDRPRRGAGENRS